jgi:hypothetical protein
MRIIITRMILIIIIIICAASEEHGYLTLPVPGISEENACLALPAQEVKGFLV